MCSPNLPLPNKCLKANSLKKQLPLFEAFATRPDRFRLLDKAMKETHCFKDKAHCLEIGCARGEAAAYVTKKLPCHIIGIDLDKAHIEQANKIHKDNKAHFLCADASSLPFKDNSFDSLYCEAAFSPLQNKAETLKECARVAKPKARFLLHDFILLHETQETDRKTVQHIPCFAGVQTKDATVKMFEKAGFRLLADNDEYSELIRILLWLSKCYGITAKDFPAYLARYFHKGPSCSLQEQEAGTDFFQKTRLSFCQMLFEKNR